MCVNKYIHILRDGHLLQPLGQAEPLPSATENQFSFSYSLVIITVPQSTETVTYEAHTSQSVHQTVSHWNHVACRVGDSVDETTDESGALRNVNVYGQATR